MRDPFEPSRRGKFGTRLLEIDAFVNSAVYRLYSGFKNAYTNYSARLERMNYRGFKRGFFELVGDGATLGVVGVIVMLAFAVPAFKATTKEWRDYQQYSVTFLDRYGAEIGQRGIRHDDGVPLSDIPDHLVKAVLATEDRRFYLHFGVDFLGTARAIISNMRAGGVVEGGSTLTQQLAKNVFLSNERTLERKIKEAFLAFWLEANLTKAEILKLYLDRAYMGGGAFGVEAAAQFYFNKSVRDVTLAEAAMMAGLFKAPTRYAPHIDLPAARSRAQEVLTNMVQAGFMTEGQVLLARRRPAEAIDRTEKKAPDYFLDYAFEEVQRLGNNHDFVLTVKTTFDADLQKAADTAVESMLRQYAKARRVKQAAMALSDINGAVHAIVGGRDYGSSQFNRATRALRQPGSSFKLYVYMAALMDGYKPNSLVTDAPICIGNWCPRNYSGGFRGRMPMITALTKSINTIPVRLSQKIGRDHIAELANKMGVETPIRVSRSLALGPAEVTVLDQLSGYLTTASGGKRTRVFAIQEMRNSHGDLIYDHERDAPAREQVIPREKAEQMNEMLVNVVNNGTARRAILPGILAGGKTGTTQAYRDAWFIGFTGNYAAAVWYGNDDFTSTGRVTGGSIPAMTWQQVMVAAHEGQKIKPIPGVGYAPDSNLPTAEEGENDGQTLRAPTLSKGAAQVLEEIAGELSRSRRFNVGRPRTDQVSVIEDDNASATR
ncbi:transglycosylase domain-containing protein [Tepidamorphus sp. 3E244]|uniref:transglycosylase domain-containing protein n=1 Tax=Tepidamorphus sp. 3E244 TaxID=3385498 RepID=UPI0038FC246F